MFIACPGGGSIGDNVINNTDDVIINISVNTILA